MQFPTGITDIDLSLNLAEPNCPTGHPVALLEKRVTSYPGSEMFVYVYQGREEELRSQPAKAFQGWTWQSEFDDQ